MLSNGNTAIAAGVRGSDRVFIIIIIIIAVFFVVIIYKPANESYRLKSVKSDQPYKRW